MKSAEALRFLAELTASQWGMVTSAQAKVHGITRLDLSRLAEAGHLKRLAHGIYKVAGAPDDEFDDLRAAWLSTDPKTMGEARIKDRTQGVVIAGASAARLHDIGDLWADRNDFVTPTRRQSQRPEIRYRQRILDTRDITLVHGLPVMTVERTIADLIETVGDLSLVADALRDASRKSNLDTGRLHELLAPLAERNGFLKSEGTALLDRLREIAGIDTESIARRVAADTTLGSRVAADYFAGLSEVDLDRLIMTPAVQETIRSVQESIATMLQNAVSAQLTELNATTETVHASLINSTGIDNLVRQISSQFINRATMKELGRAWGKSLNDSIALRPETLPRGASGR
ncbi:MAG: hypothetical protein QG671_4178 [Actinomycetota bacterium]|nr:hypothetical protein [Actinomycetota bacterium]